LGAHAAGAAINVPVAIDGITPTNHDNIYFGTYKFSRRLFLQRNPGFTDANRSGGEAAGRTAEETKLYNWVQGHTCPLATLATNAGFLGKLRSGGCGDDCSTGQNPSTLSCLKGDPGIGTPKQNIGAETGSNHSCNTSYPCVANGTLGTGTPISCGVAGSTFCPNIPVLASGAPGSACSMNEKCSGSNCAIAAGEVGGCCGSCP
jgi:hypothetical protein